MSPLAPASPPLPPLLPARVVAAAAGALRVHHAREILRLAAPTVLTMLSQTLMWTVDTALLGHVSSVALAAAGLGGMITWAGYSLFNNLSRISGTFVAQAHGKGDDPAVGAYTWQGMYLALVTGLVLQVAGFFSYLVMPWTRNPQAVQDLAYVYIRWRTLSAVATQLSFCLMGFFQGRRDVRTPMWAGIIANAINVVLDVWLIFGWAGVEIGGRRWLAVAPMGVEGAAVATSVGYFVQLAILLLCFLAPQEHRRRYRVQRPPRPDKRQVRDIIRVGGPTAWENFIDMMGFVFFSVLVGQAGAVQLAASQITVQLLAFSFMPLWGVTIAGSVLTGNWIGAGRPDLAERYGRQVYKVGLYYALALAGGMVVLRGRLFAPFTNDPAVLALGGSLALAAAFFQIWDGVRMIGSGILGGAGDTRFPMVMGLLVLWGVFIPLTYLIVRVGGGGVAEAWFGGGFCYLVLAVALYLRFRSGVWKRVKIFSDAAPAAS